MRKLAMMISIIIIFLAACGNKEAGKNSNQLEAKKAEEKKLRNFIITLLKQTV